MYALLSPAKKLNFEDSTTEMAYSQPRMLADTLELMGVARKLQPADLSRLMKISESLAELNFARFRNFATPFTRENAKQAVFAFVGDTYVGLDAPSMGPADLEFAQEHIGILSGLYGLLRPLDLVQPYRLEMGTRLSNKRGRDLYAFWGSLITHAVNETLAARKNSVVVNLASIEYFKSVQPLHLNQNVITPVFKEIKNGEAKVVSFSAKRARGMMARYIVDERLSKPEGMKSFSTAGYQYQPSLSSDSRWTYTRHAQA